MIQGQIKLKVGLDSRIFYICIHECENKTRVRKKNTGIIYTVINSKCWNIGQVKILHIEIFIIGQLVYCLCAKASFKILDIHQNIYLFERFPLFKLNFLVIWEIVCVYFCRNPKNLFVRANQNRLSILSGPIPNKLFFVIFRVVIQYFLY